MEDAFTKEGDAIIKSMKGLDKDELDTKSKQGLFDFMKTHLITSFPDIFKEALEEGDTIKTKTPIKIELDDSKDVVPMNITTPAETPAHLRPAADREIARLIRAGTIEPWEQPTEWSSRGFFVKKGTKEGEET